MGQKHFKKLWHDLITNISGTEQDVVARKAAAQTAISLAKKNAQFCEIWSTNGENMTHVLTDSTQREVTFRS